MPIREFITNYGNANVFRFNKTGDVVVISASSAANIMTHGPRTVFTGHEFDVGDFLGDFTRKFSPTVSQILAINSSFRYELVEEDASVADNYTTIFAVVTVSISEIEAIMANNG